MKFFVIIHKDPDSDYGVTVPDLPGCFSAGTTEEEALRNAVEAIQCHVEGLMQDGEWPLKTGVIEQAPSESRESGGRLAFVDVAVP